MGRRSNTMGRGIDIPCVGGQNTMGREVKIPWIRRSNYHRLVVQYTMGRGFKIPWIGNLDLIEYLSGPVHYQTMFLHHYIGFTL